MFKDNINRNNTHAHATPRVRLTGCLERGRQVYGVLEVALLSKDPVASKRLPRIKKDLGH